MCGVRLWHQWQHGIRNRGLRRRLKIESLDQLVAARKLRWAGHVARMGHERLPRRFLTSWIRNPRPHGRPQFTYGHSLNKTLEWAGISTDFAVWSELAQDRPAWRALILATAEYPPPRASTRRKRRRRRLRRRRRRRNKVFEKCAQVTPPVVPHAT